MISFRTAAIDDSEKVALLVNSAYRGDSSRMGWTTEADLLEGQRTDPDKIKEMIEEKQSSIELCYEDETLVGSVYLKQESSDTIYFGMLTVSPALQGSGLGKKILIHLEEVAKKRGCSKIRMAVIQQRSELIAFYERRGYQKTGRTEPFPMNDPRFGLPKRDDLEFIEFIKDIS